MDIEKARKYCGILLVLEDNKALSLALRHDYKMSIIKDCKLTTVVFESCMKYARVNIHIDSSCLYVDWKTDRLITPVCDSGLEGCNRIKCTGAYHEVN